MSLSKTATSLQSLEERFAKVQESASEQLGLFRKQAWTEFSKQGLPHTKDEAYQYCRKPHLQLEDWMQIQVSNASLNGFETPLFQEKNSPRVLVNWDASSLSLPENLPAGISIESLSGAAISDLEALNQIVSANDLSESTKDSLAYLNDALFESALVIKVNKFSEELALKGLQLNLRYIASTGLFSKVLIHLGPNVELKLAIVEEVFQSEFNHVSIHVQLDENAKLELVRIQTSDESSSALNHIESIQAANSNYRQIQATMGAKLARSSIINLLQGPGAESNFFGVAVLDETLQSHTYLQLEHQAPHTESNQRFSQALLGSSMGSLDGTVVVCKDAQKVNSDQLIKTLMLSDKAKAQGKPNLKIYADDVKCAHGNTCGQLEDSYLFYLMSRGIAKNQAREILTRGFVEDILDEIHLPILKKAVDDEMLSRLIIPEAVVS